MIESDRVDLLHGEVEIVDTPSNSGKGQKIARCPKCRIAVWSHYAGAGDAVSFVRVGTLDEPDRLPPDVHIFTASKQPWVVIPSGMPAVPEYYKAAESGRKTSLERREALLAAKAAREAGASRHDGLLRAFQRNPRGVAERGRLRGLPADRRAMDAASRVPYVRSHRLLRGLPSRSRARALQRYRHPMISSLERGETWGWCYVHRRYFDPMPGPLPKLRSGVRRLLGRIVRR